MSNDKQSPSTPGETKIVEGPAQVDVTRVSSELPPGETQVTDGDDEGMHLPGAPKMIRRTTSPQRAVRRGQQKTGKYGASKASTTKKRVDVTLHPSTQSEQTTDVGDHEDALEEKILKKLGQHEQRSAVSRDPLIGRTIANRFQILSKVGVGGMGAVYKAKQKGMDRFVAIKTLLNEFASNETVVKRFHLEALAVSKLAHPNTISIYDFGQTDDGILYIAMEFLEGSALEQVLRKDLALPVKRALHIMKQVCLSLTEAHAKGIVHRDLKPDNIFLVTVGNDSDFAKVLDFGVAKLRVADQNQGTLTQAGVIFGTPKYMSPEQSRSLDLDPRSDIYSLGVILFEMLTGEPPFEAENPLAILIQHVQTPPPPMREVRPDLLIPQEVEAIVRRALSKKPQDRQQSVQDMVTEIEDVEFLLKARHEFDIVLTRDNIGSLDIRPEYRASLTHPSGIVSLLPIDESTIAPYRSGADRDFPLPVSDRLLERTDPAMRQGTGLFSQDHVPTSMIPGLSDQQLAAAMGKRRGSSVGKWIGLTFLVLVVLVGSAAGVALYKMEKLPDSYYAQVYAFENFSSESQTVFKTSKMVFTTRPPGAQIYRGHKRIGDTREPFAIEKLLGGRAERLTLIHTQHVPREIVLTFNAEAERQQNFDLEPLQVPLVKKKKDPVILKKDIVKTKGDPLPKKDPTVVVDTNRKTKKGRKRRRKTLANKTKKKDPTAKTNKKVGDLKDPYSRKKVRDLKNPYN